jgi:hypothetical protein
MKMLSLGSFHQATVLRLILSLAIITHLDVGRYCGIAYEEYGEWRLGRGEDHMDQWLRLHCNWFRRKSRKAYRASLLKKLARTRHWVQVPRLASKDH